MGKNIWISSDQHLFHENILKFVDEEGNRIRPKFSNISDMNEYILEKHNSLVKPGDIHYCLGDIFLGKNEDDFKSFWPKFNGRKRLIVGNHDDIKFLSTGSFFQKILMWKQFREFDIIMSHVPLHESSMWVWSDKNAPLYNVHGHIHQHLSPTFMHHNVSMEVIDYTPVHIEDLAVLAKQRREEWKEKNEDVHSNF